MDASGSAKRNTGKLPVLGADPPATLDQVAQVCSSEHDRWCNCTWDKRGAGLDPVILPQTFYTSLVDLYSSWGVDLIKWAACTKDLVFSLTSPENMLAKRCLHCALLRHKSDPSLSWSPGGSRPRFRRMDDSWGRSTAPEYSVRPVCVALCSVQQAIFTANQSAGWMGSESIVRFGQPVHATSSRSEQFVRRQRHS